MAFLLLLFSVPGRPLQAAAPPLPAPGEVFAIAVRPHAHQLPEYFTPETLLRALPHFKPAYIDVPIGGKIWWQSGVIVRNNGEVLFWRTFRDDLIAIEINGYAYHFYALQEPSAIRKGDSSENAGGSAE